MQLLKHICSVLIAATLTRVCLRYYRNVSVMMPYAQKVLALTEDAEITRSISWFRKDVPLLVKCFYYY